MSIEWAQPKTDWLTNPKVIEGVDHNRIEKNIEYLKEVEYERNIFYSGFAFLSATQPLTIQSIAITIPDGFKLMLRNVKYSTEGRLFINDNNSPTDAYFDSFGLPADNDVGTDFLIAQNDTGSDILKTFAVFAVHGASEIPYSWAIRFRLDEIGA